MTFRAIAVAASLFLPLSIHADSLLLQFNLGDTGPGCLGNSGPCYSPSGATLSLSLLSNGQISAGLASNGTSSILEFDTAVQPAR